MIVNLRVTHFLSHGASCSSIRQLRLPGPQGARCFEFGTPYEEIARALSDEAEAHYTRVGVLDLARRAAATKTAPQVRP